MVSIAMINSSISMVESSIALINSGITMVESRVALNSGRTMVESSVVVIIHSMHILIPVDLLVGGSRVGDVRGPMTNVPAALVQEPGGLALGHMPNTSNSWQLLGIPVSLVYRFLCVSVPLGSIPLVAIVNGSIALTSKPKVSGS